MSRSATPAGGLPPPELQINGSESETGDERGDLPFRSCMVARIENHSSSASFRRRLGEHPRRQVVKRHHDVSPGRERNYPLTGRSAIPPEQASILSAWRVRGVDDDAAFPFWRSLQHDWNVRPGYSHDDDLRTDGLLKGGRPDRGAQRPNERLEGRRRAAVADHAGDAAASKVAGDRFPKGARPDDPDLFLLQLRHANHALGHTATRPPLPLRSPHGSRRALSASVKQS